MSKKQNVQSSNPRVEPMKTEHARMTAEAKPNMTKRLAESTRAASVSISPSWSPIEQMSDIVFVQILRFVGFDSLRYVYFNI